MCEGRTNLRLAQLLRMHWGLTIRVAPKRLAVFQFSVKYILYVNFNADMSFRRSVAEYSVLLGHYATSEGNRFPTFRGKAVISPSMVEMSLTLESECVVSSWPYSN